MLAEADTGNLRVRKHDPWHGGIIVALVTAQNGILHRKLGAVGSHVDELIPVGHIARRVDAGHRGPHVVANHDGSARVGLHADLFQSQTIGIGTPSSG